MESIYREITIPSSLTWTSDQVSSVQSSYDTSWPPADQPDRIITRNYGTRVIVCTTTWDLPHIERSAPIFTNLQATHSKADPDDAATIIDAAVTHLEPDGPHHFRYGVKYHEIQTMSNTPERFLEDFDNIHRYVTYDPALDEDLPQAGDGTTEARLGITAAALWPVHYGWFYIEGDFGYDASNPLWHYGLLLPNPLIDPTEVMPFFEAVSDDPPRVQHQWPRHKLVASTMGQRPPLTHTEVIGDELAVPADREKPLLPLHGTNPFYGTDTEAISSEPESHPSESLPSDLYNPLSNTSTLLYELDISLRDGDNYRIERVSALEPPTIHSLFVTAKATRHN